MLYSVPHPAICYSIHPNQTHTHTHMPRNCLLLRHLTYRMSYGTSRSTQNLHTRGCAGQPPLLLLPTLSKQLCHPTSLSQTWPKPPTPLPSQPAPQSPPCIPYCTSSSRNQRSELRNTRLFANGIMLPGFGQESITYLTCCSQVRQPAT